MAITAYSDLSAFGKIVYTRYQAGTVAIEQVTTLKTNGKITAEEFNYITGAA